MLKLILWAFVALIAWYVFAPLITPKSLRRKPPRRKPGKDDKNVIEGSARIID